MRILRANMSLNFANPREPTCFIYRGLIPTVAEQNLVVSYEGFWS
jgi:hypothetical protein